MPRLTKATVRIGENIREQPSQRLPGELEDLLAGPPSRSARIVSQRDVGEAVALGRTLILRNRLGDRQSRPFRPLRSAPQALLHRLIVLQHAFRVPTELPIDSLFESAALRPGVSARLRPVSKLRAGVPEEVATAIGGHKTRSVFDRYNIVNGGKPAESLSKALQGDSGRLQPAGLEPEVI